MLVSINSFDWVIFTGKDGEEDVFEICAIELKEINDKVKQLHVMIWFSSLFIVDQLFIFYAKKQ